MFLQPKDVRLYSRNKNIVFEGSKQERVVNKLIYEIIDKFSRLTISQSRAVITERIIEYPIVFQYLDKNWRYILDFGCAEDLLPIHLASLGYDVTGLDFRPYPFTHQNFRFIQADVLRWEPPKEKFDCVISISTIEHIGLGGYGDPAQNNGDKIAVDKLLTALKQGGKLIVTVPFGKSTIQRNMRIYNHNSLYNLIPNIETERFFFKPKRYGSWSETTWREIDNFEYEDYYKISPAQGVAFVIAKRL